MVLSASLGKVWLNQVSVGVHVGVEGGAGRHRSAPGSRHRSASAASRAGSDLEQDAHGVMFAAIPEVGVEASVEARASGFQVHQRL